MATNTILDTKPKARMGRVLCFPQMNHSTGVMSTRLDCSIEMTEGESSNFWVEIPENADLSSLVNEPEGAWSVRQVQSQRLDGKVVTEVKLAGVWLELNPS